MRLGTRSVAAILAALSALVIAFVVAPVAGAATTLPEHFEDQTIWGGLNKPTIVRFAPNGEIFVGEKSGEILVYENLQDTEPEVFANLSKQVYDFEDHGILGIAIDPMFDLGSPYVYVLYTFNHELANKGQQEPTGVEPRLQSNMPRWPSAGPGYENDKCQESEEKKSGAIPKEALGCEVSGVLVRLTAEGNHAKPPPGGEPEEAEEKVLLEGWCQQATTHSIGDLGFGPEGDLYVSGGEGAMYSQPDYGQFGNPCEDPVEESGGEVVRATALGGSLRSQSVLRDHSLPNHPTLLSGTVLRINPETGEGVEGNPFYAEGPYGETSTEKNMKRIYAFGFRQPWRFSFNDRTSKLFVSNVGNGAFEEIDRVSLDESTAYNSGWPCYEGGPEGRERNYEYAGEYEEEGKIIPYPSIDYCEHQYEEEELGNPETNAPFYSYAHNGPVVPGDRCWHGTKLATDVSGSAFYEGTSYPSAYDDAFFFADAIRGCIYVLRSAPDGEPDPSTATTFLSNPEPYSFPAVDLEQGPEGNIFYVELYGEGGGSVHRIVYKRPLKVGKAGSGSGTVTSAPAGIDCGSTCEAEFEVGPLVTLKGSPAAGSQAPTWSGCDAVNSSDKCEVTMSAAKSVTATFTASPEKEKEAEKVTPPPPNHSPPIYSPPIYSPPKIKRRPGKNTIQRSAKFVFSGQGETHFRCRLDGKAFSSCRSPRTYKNLKPGKHSFRVYAADASDNRLSANRVFQWNIAPK